MQHWHSTNVLLEEEINNCRKRRLRRHGEHICAHDHPDIGREPGPRIIRTELLRHGLPESALPVSASELDAVRAALDWARPGDVLALPVHSAAARSATLAMLNAASRSSR